MKCKELYHPVLGKYYSEEPVEQILPNLKDKYSRSTMAKSLEDPSVSVMDAVRDHHTRLFDKGNRRQLFDNELALGQVVLVKRKLTSSDAQSQTFFGVLIEKSGHDLQAYIRLRTVMMQTGVELKIPVFSPLVQDIKILKSPTVPVVGPNLLGLRKSTEAMARFINPVLFTERGRTLFLRQLEVGEKGKHSTADKDLMRQTSHKDHQHQASIKV